MTEELLIREFCCSMVRVDGSFEAGLEDDAFFALADFSLRRGFEGCDDGLVGGG